MRHVTSFRSVFPVCALALFLFAALAMAGGMAGSARAADAGGLVNALTSQLGVTKPQAEGGAGALFNLAKQRMAPEQFGQVQSQVPGIDGLMGTASSASSSKGQADSGGLAGMATGALGSVGGGGAAGGLGALAPPGMAFSASGAAVGRGMPVPPAPGPAFKPPTPVAPKPGWLKPGGGVGMP